jgi:hypothetical protein
MRVDKGRLDGSLQHVPGRLNRRERVAPIEPNLEGPPHDVALARTADGQPDGDALGRQVSERAEDGSILGIRSRASRSGPGRASTGRRGSPGSP